MPPKKTQQPSLEERKAKAQAEAKANAEREREAQKTAQTAVEAKKKAQKLGQAAAACGDPDERQKLLKQKVDQEVKAETFGKTAKWIQTSGSFQGFAAGSGLGIGLGAAVGTLTGTLVGGPTGLITGGIGAGIGKLHGPFVNISDWGLDKIRGITGDLPGWEATAEQKKTLEKMCGQVAETEAPGPEELENIAGNVAGGNKRGGCTDGIVCSRYQRFVEEDGGLIRPNLGWRREQRGVGQATEACSFETATTEEHT
jgi:hypothetical protein